MHPGSSLTRKRGKKLRLRIQVFILDLLQLKAVCLSSQEKRENLKKLRIRVQVLKKTKAAQMIVVSNNPSSPDGLIWDGDNYSCAYDALLTILYEIWSTDTKAWTRKFKEINQHHLKSMSACFKKYMNGQASFETARDTIRHEIHSQSPAQFPYGTRGTSVSALASAILAPQNFVTISSPEC